MKLNLEFIEIDKTRQKNLENQLTSLITVLILSSDDTKLIIRNIAGCIHISPKSGIAGYNFNTDLDQKAFGYGIKTCAVATQDELFYFHAFPE